MGNFFQEYDLLLPFVLLIPICLFAIVKSIRQVRRFPQIRYFKIILLFFLLTFFQIMIGFIETFFLDVSDKIRGRRSPTNISLFIYVICEYQVYVYLLLNFIKSLSIKIYLRISAAFVLLFALILWFSPIDFVLLMSFYTLTEALLLLPVCFYFFYEILAGPPILKLNKEPAFWIVTGIIFLFVCLIPTYIGMSIIHEFHPIGIMDYIGYCILIILFLKGLTCKTVQMA